MRPVSHSSLFHKHPCNEMIFLHIFGYALKEQSPMLLEQLVEVLSMCNCNLLWHTSLQHPSTFLYSSTHSETLDKRSPYVPVLQSLLVISNAGWQSPSVAQAR